jgi:pimeloyl-ACP methyl ester carboxylesterase
MRPLIFLHGALGTEGQVQPLTDKMNRDGENITLTFEGHGSRPGHDRKFRIEYFAENVLEFMNNRAIQQADMFGYSMGGYVALWLARNHPERIGKIATLGTVLVWSKEKAEHEARLLNPDVIEEKVPGFASLLDSQHPQGWRSVVDKTREMLLHLGSYPLLIEDDWKALEHTVRLHIGDRDETASVADTLSVFNCLKAGELNVLPDTSHPIKDADLDLLSLSLDDFFSIDT